MTAPSSPTDDRRTTPTAARSRQVAFTALACTMAAVQFSIAVSQMCLAVSIAAWVTVLVVEQRRPTAPAWALPLLLYASWSLVSALTSVAPVASLIASKQIVLLLLVPLTYELTSAEAALSLTTLILASGACSAVIGIGQYSLLHYDNLGQRPHGTLGMYMTFSGLMMLVLNLAVARVLFMGRARIWPALVIPALGVVLALSFTRSAWVGWCIGAALLLMMRDWRLTALLPLVAGLFLALAPTQVVHRLYSIFDLHDPTNRDRLAMLRAGEHIVRAHPLTGVGPQMMPRIYPEYREPDAILQRTSHLHNVPMQIAAERGLPALGLWLWFITALVASAGRLFRGARSDGLQRCLAAVALTSVASMIGAGMFEHNFGDSEFQMVFLVLVTLPFAATRAATAIRGPNPVSAGSGGAR